MVVTMRSLLLLMVLTRFCCSYARTDRASRQKKLYSLKVLSPVFLTVEHGKTMTMHCPVKPTVMRMYKYVRRVRQGKGLEFASRKLAVLLGLKYKWYKDGKSIRHHRAAWSMKLSKVQCEDAGLYTCKVLSTKGGSVRNFTVKVFEQPKPGHPILETNEKNVTLKTGATTFLECVSKNTKMRPYIRWLKWYTKNNDSQAFSNDIRGKLQRPGKFYKVINPRFYENFALRRKDGTRRQMVYGFRLRLKNVGPNDSGMYSCFVGNNRGTDHRNFFARVKSSAGVAPYNSNPRKMAISFMAWPALSSTKLKCYVAGDQPLNYKWYKDGQQLYTRRMDPKINTSSWILRLRELVPSDSGVYTCAASNPYGVYKHNVTVKVVERIRSSPVLQPIFPKNVSVAKGQNVSLDCIELVSGPLPDYRWYKWHSIPAGYPKLDLQNTSQFTVINPIHYSTIRVRRGKSYKYGGRLTLTNITQDDFGLYTCVVRNHIGYDYSSAFISLDNSGGPEFLPSKYRPPTINIPTTDVLNLDCSATGIPKPKVSWQKNGKPLALSFQSNSMVVSGSVLKLIKLKPNHSGNYTCNVSNSKGTISHTFSVNIKEQLFSRPIILPPVKKAVKFGEKYELKCTVVSAEPLKVTWVRAIKTKTKTRKEILIGNKAEKLEKYVHSFSHVIPEASKEDSGVYWCIAKNDVGVTSKKFEIQVEA